MRGWLGKLIAGRHWPTEVQRAQPPALAPAPWYSAVPEGELRLGELITGLRDYRFRHHVQGEVEVEAIVHSYVLVATPECDLLQSFKDLRGGRSLKGKRCSQAAARSSAFGLT